MSREKPTMDLVALFQCLRPSLPSTTWRQLSRIAGALLVMTGRVTMLGLSRWAGTGGSYRTVQPEFRRIAGWLDALLHLIAGVIPLTYLVLAGHFGNHNALHMARQCGLHLVSKLRCDAALYIPYTGPYAGRGPHRKYGPKID